jgi:peptide/nickel transport system ATP-binding protein
VIFVTHDVGVAIEIAERPSAMHAGRFVETGPMDEVIRTPRPPYAQGLLAGSVHGSFRDYRLEAVPGLPGGLAPGSALGPRCWCFEDRRTVADPPELRMATDHVAHCVGASAELVAAVVVAPPCA